MSRLLIVSNRLPVALKRRGGRLSVAPSSGGVATGLGAYHAQQEDSLWLGWAGAGDGVSPHNWAAIEAGLAARRCQPVPLTADDVGGFYDGFSNGVLWPLCHYLLDEIPLDTHHWDTYEAVNRRFADEVTRVHRAGDLIWVNDYHLMLVPGLLRARIPDARIAYFHHIPFPSFEIFRTLPWQRLLLQGLLGADLIGLHTDSYVQHLRTAFHRALGTDGGHHDVTWQGRRVVLGAYPMGIDAARFAAKADEHAVREEAERIRSDARGRTILLGVDRLDYTKGIPRRLLAFERLLAREPSLRDQVRLVQIAVPSRGDVPAYRSFRGRVEAAVGRINGQYGTLDAQPIHYLHRSVSEDRLVALYRAAHALIVSPLRDGMNLVAKEFVAARTDLDGILMLSEFAGAAEELREALIINPYDIDGMADRMLQALRMPVSERQTRMQALRRRVLKYPVDSWASRLLGDLAELTGTGTATATMADARDEAVTEHVTQLATHAAAIHLFVDYDGTLVPFAEVPELASPDPGLLTLLGQLTATPGLHVHLVSGRMRQTLADWFGGSGLSLWAEHGLWRSQDGHTWDAAGAADSDVLAEVLPLLEHAAARTPGASVELKSASVAWHYRMADPVSGPDRARDLGAELARRTAAGNLEVINGSKVIEVRSRGIHKGLAVQHVRGLAGPDTLFLAIGDDVTDEDMFAALQTSGISISVGDRPSNAHYHLRNWQAVRHLLSRIITARTPPAVAGALTTDGSQPGATTTTSRGGSRMP